MRNINKIFGIGLSRTGTTSLTVALEQLGYKGKHFPSDPRTRTEIYDFFSTRPHFIKLSILQIHTVITDTPVCCLFEALDQAYPNSRFILTIRNKESWLRSCEKFWKETLIPNQKKDEWERVAYINFIDTCLYGIPYFDKPIFSKIYDGYHTKVLRYFKERPNDLLVLDICGGDEWTKLTTFLGMAIPKQSFPFENRSTTRAEQKTGQVNNLSRAVASNQN